MFEKIAEKNRINAIQPLSKVNSKVIQKYILIVRTKPSPDSLRAKRTVSATLTLGFEKEMIDQFSRIKNRGENHVAFVLARGRDIVISSADDIYPVGNVHFLLKWDRRYRKFELDRTLQTKFPLGIWNYHHI